MKVVPALLDHPKYLRLKRLIGDLALEYLLRLWSHCEANQKGEAWTGADGEYVEMVCRFPVNSDGKLALFDAFVLCGFIEKKRGAIVIHDWNSTNSRAVSNWDLGHREKKSRKPKDKPAVSLGLPLADTNRKPVGSPMNEGMNDNTPIVPGALPGLAISADDFQTFWDAYPRKVFKKVAAKAWKQAKARPPIAEILAAIERAKNTTQWSKGELEFIPHPSTWIKQERWDDGFSEKKERGGEKPAFDLDAEPAQWREWFPEFSDLNWNQLPQDIQLAAKQREKGENHG